MPTLSKISVFAKKTKSAVLCKQASSWQCHFVKKHYLHANIPIDWIRNTHAHDVTVFIKFTQRQYRYWFQKLALGNQFSSICIFRPLKHHYHVNESLKWIKNYAV